MLKLSKACGGDKPPVREIAGTSKAFLSGIEQVYLEYNTQKHKYPGQLPVISLVSTTPVISGSGTTKSTNYRPTFRIDGWAKRPDDLLFLVVATPVDNPVDKSAHDRATQIKPDDLARANGSGMAPSTGSQTVPPPNRMAATQNLDDDFG
jgi:hypothetical protein